MSKRQIRQVLVGRPTRDGDGVALTRVFDSQHAALFDPFLMLDEFGSDAADDYIGGFPPHPHRGFETVTYMLEGRMLHEDHLGNRGLLEPGGLQWMTAGRGIIHSEMPRQQSGRMRGLQLWVNLPARDKLQPAGYLDLPPEALAEHRRADGSLLRLLAGRLDIDGQQLLGPISDRPSQPLLLDIQLSANAELCVPLPESLNALLYVLDGQLRVDDRPLRAQQLAHLGSGTQLQLDSPDSAARALLIAGQPIGEPIAQYGPFVMNTREEIEQAISDYRRGRLTD